MRRYAQLRARKPWTSKRDADHTKDERRDYAAVGLRAGNRCEVVLNATRCPRPKMFGLHHVTKRSQGGRKFSSPDTLMALCLRHHDLADNASSGQRTLIDGQWVRGRLRIVALGGGDFRCWLETEPTP